MLLHKPYGVLSQFTPEPGSRWGCLAELVPVPGVYAAGRLDADSEGLLLLTSNGRLQHRLTDPRWGHWRRYWVQVEGIPSDLALKALRQGIHLKDGFSLPARVQQLPPRQRDAIAPRQPAIRERRNIPTTWLELELQEGRNRQVRRMTAAIGFPTLRLIRRAIDLMDGAAPLDLEGLKPGCWRPMWPEELQRLKKLSR